MTCLLSLTFFTTRKEKDGRIRQAVRAEQRDAAIANPVPPQAGVVRAGD
jgi:hypothetical protein